MEPDIFRFIYRYSKREQIILLAITAISYPFFYFSLNIPKDIVNHLNAVVKHIGDGHGRTPADYPVQALFDLVSLNAYSYLFALCGLFLGLVLINGAFKYIINVVSGRTGERLLRRLRYQLYTRMLRFPLPQFRKTSQGELIAMITAEVEPLGGFMGTAVSDPIYQGGLLMVPLIFILVQDPLMGFAAMMLYPAQAYFIPKMQRKVNELGKQRVRTVRKLAERTQKATKEISVTISHIQSDVNRVVQSMQSGVQNAEDGKNAAANAAEAIERIIMRTEEFAGSIHELAAMSDLLTGRSRTISESIDVIKNVAQNSTELTSIITDSAGNLTKSSNTLLDSIQRFKVHESSHLLN